MFKKLMVNTAGRAEYVTPLLKANNAGKCVITHKCLFVHDSCKDRTTVKSCMSK